MSTNHFQSKDLFLSTTLIAVGLAMATLPFGARFDEGTWHLHLLPQSLWICAGALIGTGMLHPFSRAAYGVIIGILVQIVFYYIYFVPIETLFR